MRTRIWVTLLAGGWVFIVATSEPLTAQQTVVVPDVNVENTNVIDGIQLDVTLTMPPCDSACVARDEATQRFRDRFVEWMDTCGCVNQGPATTVNVISNIALTLAVLLVAYQISKGREDGKDGVDGQAGPQGEPGQDGQDGTTNGDSESEH